MEFAKSCRFLFLPNGSQMFKQNLIYMQKDLLRQQQGQIAIDCSWKTCFPSAIYMQFPPVTFGDRGFGKA